MTTDPDREPDSTEPSGARSPLASPDPFARVRLDSGLDLG